ncbi:MAG: hypothetical protein ACO2ZM_06800 [Francisellaceae bacterium]
MGYADTLTGNAWLALSHSTNQARYHFSYYIKNVIHGDKYDYIVGQRPGKDYQTFSVIPANSDLTSFSTWNTALFQAREDVLTPYTYILNPQNTFTFFPKTLLDSGSVSITMNLPIYNNNKLVDTGEVLLSRIQVQVSEPIDSRSSQIEGAGLVAIAVDGAGKVIKTTGQYSQMTGFTSTPQINRSAIKLFKDAKGQAYFISSLIGNNPSVYGIYKIDSIKLDETSSNNIELMLQVSLVKNITVPGGKSLNSDSAIPQAVLSAIENA